MMIRLTITTTKTTIITIILQRYLRRREDISEAKVLIREEPHGGFTYILRFVGRTVFPGKL